MPDPQTPSSSRQPALDLLRAALTVLVVAHHAVLAYHPDAPAQAAFSGQNLLWTAFPVVDSSRWPAAALLVLFDETFFMALFFLVSGLFVWPTLSRGGPAAFLRSRALRLGVPFALAAAFLAPLAYVPPYLAAGGTPSVLGFARAWRGLGVWPAGPAWFLWVLLAFDALAAVAFALGPRLAPSLGARLAFGRERPARAFLVAMALAVATYVPLALAVNPLAWWNAGPFFVQTSRIGLYLAWFALGTALGAAGPGQGILAREGRLARTPGRWIAASALAFVGFVAALLFALAAYGRGTPSVALDALASTAYAISCAATSFAALACALRWLRAPGALGLALSRDAFGIYLLHYPAVSWLQRMLLPVALPGVAKAGIVLAGAVGLSWAASAAFRAVVQGLRASWAGPSITSAHSRPRA